MHGATAGSIRALSAQLGTAQICSIFSRARAHLDSLVIFGALEALLLHARHVEHVGLLEHGLELRVVRKVAPARCARARKLEHLCRHSQRLWRDELHLHAVKRAELHERVDRAPVLQVADARDREPAQRAELGLDGVEVEQRLRRVLARTVALQRSVPQCASERRSTRLTDAMQRRANAYAHSKPSPERVAAGTRARIVGIVPR